MTSFIRHNKYPNNKYKRKYIYYILLEKNKYYVSVRENKYTLCDEFIKVGKPDWLLVYKPIRILKIIEQHDEYTVCDYVIDLMKKKGIENVRGEMIDDFSISTHKKQSIKEKIKTINIPMTYLEYIEEESDMESRISNLDKLYNPSKKYPIKGGLISRILSWICNKQNNNDINIDMDTSNLLE